MLSLVWWKLCLCDQQTQGSIPKINWCWSELHSPEGLVIKGIDQGRGKWVDQGAVLGQYESKRKEGENVLLKKWHFCMVTLTEQNLSCGHFTLSLEAEFFALHLFYQQKHWMCSASSSCPLPFSRDEGSNSRGREGIEEMEGTMRGEDEGKRTEGLGPLTKTSGGLRPQGMTKELFFPISVFVYMWLSKYVFFVNVFGNGCILLLFQ